MRGLPPRVQSVSLRKKFKLTRDTLTTSRNVAQVGKVSHLKPREEVGHRSKVNAQMHHLTEESWHLPSIFYSLTITAREVSKRSMMLAPSLYRPQPQAVSQGGQEHEICDV